MTTTARRSCAGCQKVRAEALGRGNAALIPFDSWAIRRQGRKAAAAPPRVALVAGLARAGGARTLALAARRRVRSAADRRFR